MPRQSAERCSICSQHRWAVDNEYLANGSAAARRLCEELGISQSAFYRHIKSHLPLSVSTPPAERTPIEWTRAAANLAAAVEAYRIIVDPGRILDIAILVGCNDDGQFVQLAITYSAGGIDHQAVGSMAFDLGLDVQDVELIGGMTPARRMSAELHAPEVFVGRRVRR